MILTRIEKIYWAIYRWFRWDFKRFPFEIKQGIVNLYKWRKIIWKDRDWDFCFILRLMEFKMKNTLTELEKFEKSDRYTKYLKICISLIEKLQEEQYLNEWFEYCEIKFVTNRTESNINQIKYEFTYNNLKEYIEKYPHAKNIALNHKKYEHILKWGDHGLCTVIGIVRHEKAKKLFFKIMNNEIENWYT